MILCERLELIPASVSLLEADLRGGEALEAALGVAVPASWPPELYDRDAMVWTRDRLREHPDEDGWWSQYVVRRATADAPAVVVGVAGYKGPPDERGAVEIGYSLVPEHRHQGYATEAARALVRHAFSLPEVTRVMAETLPELHASIAVMERCGFMLEGKGSEAETIRFALTRAGWEAHKHFPRRDAGDPVRPTPVD